MRDLPFDKPGRFWRGNLHCHSTRSDGKLAPEDVVRAYREAGYDFIALTDHFQSRYGYPITDTRRLRGGGLTTILGAELHAPATSLGDLWHLVGVGLPLDFAPPADGETGPQLARRAADAGAWVGIAHPEWYGLTLADAEAIDAAHAVEIHNEGAARATDRGEGWYACDGLLARGRVIGAYAADDAHFSGHGEQFGAWVMVRAEEPEPEALLAALKAGHHYSSRGPEIHDVAVEGDRVRVECSPAAAVYASGRPPAAVYERGDGLTACALPLERFGGSWFRITVVGEDGRRAWTNAIRPE